MQPKHLHDDAQDTIESPTRDQPASGVNPSGMGHGDTEASIPGYAGTPDRGNAKHITGAVPSTKLKPLPGTRGKGGKGRKVAPSRSPRDNPDETKQDKAEGMNGNGQHTAKSTKRPATLESEIVPASPEKEAKAADIKEPTQKEDQLKRRLSQIEGGSFGPWVEKKAHGDEGVQSSFPIPTPEEIKEFCLATGGGYGAVDRIDGKFVVGGHAKLKRHSSVKTAGVLQVALKRFQGHKSKSSDFTSAFVTGAGWQPKTSGVRKNSAGQLIIKFKALLKKPAKFRLTLYTKCSCDENGPDFGISESDIWCWSSFKDEDGAEAYPSTRSMSVPGVSPPEDANSGLPKMRQVLKTTLAGHSDESGDRWVFWDVNGHNQGPGAKEEGKVYNMMAQIGLITKEDLAKLWQDGGKNWSGKNSKVVFRFVLSYSEEGQRTKETTFDREVHISEIMWKGMEEAKDEKLATYQSARDSYWGSVEGIMDEIQSLSVCLCMKPAPVEDSLEKDYVIKHRLANLPEASSSLIAAGRMTWENHFQQQSAAYIRVPARGLRGFHDTNPHLLKFLIQHVWGMSSPELLITVTGGARDFQLSTEQKDSLLKGLTRAAKTMNAWFIDGGTDAGIMKYMGEARVQYASQVPLIGVAPWGAVAGRQRLLRKAAGPDETIFNESHLVKYQEACSEFGGIYKRMNENKGQKKIGRTGLDHNHSHFILVHDGSTYFGNEVHTRTSLEACIAEGKDLTAHIARELKRQGLGWNGVNMQAVRPRKSKAIPSVCVCVQGGPGTINTVYEAVEKGTPVLLVKGSGKAADLIADMVLLYGDKGDKGEKGDKKTGKKKLKLLVKSDETYQSKQLRKALQGLIAYSTDRSTEKEVGEEAARVANEEKPTAVPGGNPLEALQHECEEFVDKSKSESGRQELQTEGWQGFQDQVIAPFREVLQQYKLTESSGASGEERKKSQGVANFLRQLIRISISQMCYVHDLNDDSPSQKDLNHALLQCIRHGAPDSRLPFEKKILLAVQWNQKDVLRSILEEHKEELYKIVPHLNESLATALEADFAEIVEMLFDHGATLDDYSIKQKVIKKEWLESEDKTKRPSLTASFTSREGRAGSNAFVDAVKEDHRRQLNGKDTKKADELISVLRNARNFKRLMDVGKTNQLCQHASALREEIKGYLLRSASVPGKMFRDCRWRTRKIRDVRDEENDHQGHKEAERHLLKKTVQAHKNLLITDRLYRNLLGEDFRYKSGMMGPEWDLFLWSILMNRQKLALLLWEKTSRPVVSALTAAILYKAMVKSPLIMSQIKESMLANAAEFEDIAIRVQTAARDEDNIYAIQALERPQGLWSGLTCYDLAVEGDCREFIRQCCSTASANRWTGDLVPNHNWLDLTVELSGSICIFTLGLLAPLVLKYENPPPCAQLRGPAQRRKIPQGYPQPFDNDILKNQYEAYKQKFSEASDAQEELSFWEWFGLTQEKREKERWFQTMQKIQKNPSLVLKLSEEETRKLWAPTFSFAERWLCFIYAPVVLFVFQALLYTAVVFVFTHELVVHVQPLEGHLSAQESFVLCWVACASVHELIQIRNAGIEYIFDFWNAVDLLTISIFWSGMYYRLLCLNSVECWNNFGWDNSPLENPVEPSIGNLLDPEKAAIIEEQSALIGDQLFRNEKGYQLRSLGRQLFGLSCFFFWLRILRIFSVQRSLGPLVRAIGKMMADIANFFFVWIVLTMAFAIAIHAGNTETDCLEPDDPQAIHGYCHKGWWWLWRLYFQSFGELFLDELNDAVSLIILMAALLFLQLVLMNTVFVAIITSTFEEVWQQSYQTYLFDMYDLTNEYISFSAATPIPFNLLSVLYHFYTALAWRGHVNQMIQDEKDGGLRPSNSRRLHTRLRNPRFSNLDVLPEEIRRELDTARAEVVTTPRKEAKELDLMLPSEVRQVESLMERAKLMYLDETRVIERKKEIKKKRITHISKQVKQLERQLHKLGARADEVNEKQNSKISQILKSMPGYSSVADRPGTAVSGRSGRGVADQSTIVSPGLNDSGHLASALTNTHSH